MITLPNRLPLWALRFFHLGQYLLTAYRRYPFADTTSHLSCQPIFIIGPGRSGTTLLRSMLVAGKQIAIPPETYVIGPSIWKFASYNLSWNDTARLIIALFESHIQFRWWDVNLYPAYQRAINIKPSERSLARIIDEVFKCYGEQKFPDATIWGDQSPINTFHLARIDKTFPQGKYIHMLRDGRDAIASFVDIGLELEIATNRWIEGVKHSRRLGAKIGEDRFLEVRYEQLVTEPLSILQRVCEFVGIAFDPKMLEFWRQPTTLEHRYRNRHKNLSRPISSSSIGRWRERLSKEQQVYVNMKTSELLSYLDYDSD